MNRAHRLLRAATVAVALALVVLVVVTALAPQRTSLLPWTGLLAGLLAVLHTFTLDVFPGWRILLLAAGLGTMLFMVFLI